MMNQPGIGKVPVFTDNLHRFSADIASRPVKRSDLGWAETTCEALWIQPGAPQNFIGHPVANPRKTLLH
jgi:hypothetical protein